MLDNQWFGITQISKDVIVEIKATFIHSLFFLALAAHAKYGLESLQFLHFYLFVIIDYFSKNKIFDISAKL